jgi:hypothetical protein
LVPQSETGKINCVHLLHCDRLPPGGALGNCPNDDWFASRVLRRSTRQDLPIASASRAVVNKKRFDTGVTISP